MIDEQELEHRLPGLNNLFRFSMDHHTVGYIHSTGGLKSRDLLNFNKTEPASAERFEQVMMAKGGYLNAGHFSSIKNSDRFPQLYLFTIDRYPDHDPTLTALLTWASNSGLKCFMKFCTTLAALSPSAQKVFPIIFFATSSRSSMSTSLPSPTATLSRMLLSHPTPSRHGVHLPHDSCSRNFITLRHTLTKSTDSSKTMTPPEPSALPCLGIFT